MSYRDYKNKKKALARISSNKRHWYHDLNPKPYLAIMLLLFLGVVTYWASQTHAINSNEKQAIAAKKHSVPKIQLTKITVSKTSQVPKTSKTPKKAKRLAPKLSVPKISKTSKTPKKMKRLSPKLSVPKITKAPKISKTPKKSIRLAPQLSVPKISKAPKIFKTLKTGIINWKNIVIHHSATKWGSAKRFAKYHEETFHNNGLLYHFVIGNGKGSKDGKVEKGNRWNQQLPGGHVGENADQYNETGIGICLVGNFEKYPPTKKQMKKLILLVKYLMNKYSISPDNVKVHGEVIPTKCPGRFFPKSRFYRAIGKNSAKYSSLR